MISDIRIILKSVLIITYSGGLISAGQMLNIKLLFPISQNIEWHNVSTSNLICPDINFHKRVDSGLSFTVHRPKIGKDPSITGTVCAAIELITTCTKGFFGGVDVMVSANPATITEESCRQEIASQARGDFRSSEYPQPVCSWMKTSTVKRTIVNLNSMEVHYDPYLDTLYSSLFLGGSCKGAVCPTIFENRIWIPHESLTEYCSSDHLIESKLIIYNTSESKTAFWSPEFRIVDEDNPCIMDFCGTKGLRFSSGEWVALSRQHVPKEAWVGEHFYHLKDCKKDTTVNLVETNRDVTYMTETILEEFMNEQCEITIDKIREGSLVSRIELQTLYPRAPGFFPVYKYTPGSFAVGMAHYAWVSVQPSNTFPYVSIRTSLNKSVDYKYWTMDNRTNIIDGPNGLYILKGKLVYGLEEEQTFRRLLAQSSKHIFPITSETNNIKRGFTQLLSYKSYSFSDDSSLTDAVWHPFITSVGVSVLVIVVLIGSYIGVRKKIWQNLCIKNRESKRADADDNSEEEEDYFNP